jgi:putative DNA primase/helicase
MTVWESPDSNRPGAALVRIVEVNDVPTYQASDFPTVDEPPRQSAQSEPTADEAEIATALTVIPNQIPDGQPNNWKDWSDVGLEVFAATNGSDSGFQMFDAWSRKCASKYNELHTRQRWDEMRRSPPTRTGAGAIFAKASIAVPKWRALIDVPLDQVGEVVRLSKLTFYAYDQQRADAAERLGLRLSTLDELVQRLQPRETVADDDGQGTAIRIDPVEPWPETVDGESLIADAVKAIRDYVILSPDQATAAALWCIQCHTFGVADHSPRLQIRSPAMRCGKSTMLKVISLLVPKPLPCESISVAALFRLIELCQPTMIIDEADSFFKREDGTDVEALRGILNSGHERGGMFVRTVGDDHQPKGFKTFSPLCYAWLVRRGRQVALTLADRSITVELRRKMRNETVTRFRRGRTEHLQVIRRKMARWAADHRTALTDADPQLPDELNDRAQDNWRPLIAIACEISDDAGKKAAKVAIKIAKETLENEEDTSNLALADVAAIFERINRNRGIGLAPVVKLPSETIINQMVTMEGRPWKNYRRGEPLTTDGLARLLKPYAIKPKKLRDGETTFRGYEAGPVIEARDRYADADADAADLEEEPF